MTAIHVTEITLLSKGAHPLKGQMRIGGRWINLSLNSTTRDSRVLVITDTQAGLPSTRANTPEPDMNTVLIRRRKPNYHVITVTGPALNPAHALVRVQHPPIPEVGAEIVKALKIVLPEYQFV